MGQEGQSGWVFTLRWHQLSTIHPPANPKPDAAERDADEALPLFKPDCVFSTHVRGQHRPQPIPDWSRMHVNGGPAIGSSLNYLEHEHLEQMFEAPMWFLPTLPPRLWGWN